MKKTIMIFGIIGLMFLLSACSGEQTEEFVESTDYTVAFESNGGNFLDSQTVEEGSSIQAPNVTREGYTLDGWYTSVNNGQTLDEKWSFTNNTVNNDITLFANWIVNQYTITFDTDGGTQVISITQDFDSLVSTPITPSKTGHTFTGWSEDVPTTMPAENKTLTAQWHINQYNITYNIYDNYDPLKAVPLEAGETLKSISAGTFNSSALTSSGRVFTWGDNIWGQIGDGTLINRYSPTEITSQFGLNEGEKITSVTTGNGGHFSALTSTGRVFMWGLNQDNQLGDGTKTNRPTPIEITSQFSLNSGEKIVSLSMGSAHSSALTSTGRVFMWGYNLLGGLGDGTTTARGTPTEITSQFSLNAGETILSVSLGSVHSSALTSSGRVFMWGFNSYGAIGDGTTTITRSTPKDITSEFNLNLDETLLSVSLFGDYSSALTSSGRLFMWGPNNVGQLGDGTTTDRFSPSDINSQFNLNSRETILSVILGDAHSLALTSSDRVFTWGNNESGQLGDGTTTDRYLPIDISSGFSLKAGETISSVSLGRTHSSVLTSTGRVFTWGNNESGQLGDGTTTDRYLPIEIPFKSIETTNTTAYNFNSFLDILSPRKEGYTFDGWYIDPRLNTTFELDNMPAQNLTLFGRWLPDE